MLNYGFDSKFCLHPIESLEFINYSLASQLRSYIFCVIWPCIQIDICSSPAQRLWAQVLVTQLFGCITAHVIILTQRQQHHIVRGMASIEHIYIQSIASKHSLSRETSYHVKRCMFILICMTYLCLPYCITAPWHLLHRK